MFICSSLHYDLEWQFQFNSNFGEDAVFFIKNLKNTNLKEYYFILFFIVQIT